MTCECNLSYADTISAKKKPRCLAGASLGFEGLGDGLKVYCVRNLGGERAADHCRSHCLHPNLFDAFTLGVVVVLVRRLERGVSNRLDD